MSYLHTPRLVFSGDFLADVSTVNNEPAYFDNKNFAPNYQKPEVGQGPDNPTINGWWNPEGGAVFDFNNCTVKQYELTNGTVVSSADDELIGQIIKGADGRATGKMVDLDPQQQGCSELWAVRLRILNKTGEVMLEGELQTTGFRDLGIRQFTKEQINALTKIDTVEKITPSGASLNNSIQELFNDKRVNFKVLKQLIKAANADEEAYTGNGQPRGANWNAVLKNIKWGESAHEHPFFQELKATTEADMVNVNLTGFGYYYHHMDGRFSLGKMLGAIGPYFKHEPVTFAPSRRLFGTYGFGTPPYNTLYFRYANFYLHPENSSLVLDLGNNFPLHNAIGKITLSQKFYVAISNNPVEWPFSNKARELPQDQFTMIGEVPYETGDNWLQNTAGIVTFRDLSGDIMTKLSNKQLLLLTKGKDGNYYAIARESIDGYLLRADNFVQRIDHLQNQTVYVHAYQWGKPLPNAVIKADLDPVSSSDTYNVFPNGNKRSYTTPVTGYPQTGLTFDKKVITNVNGRALMKITGNKIISPRCYIDGQVYALNLNIEQVINDSLEYSNQINVHLRSYFEIPDNPVWEDIKETMQQFSNLYPIMSKYLVDLADPESMRKAKDIMIFAFSRPLEDPLHMPVTRDLSQAKRITILRWLKAQPDPRQHGTGTSFDRTGHNA